MKLGLLVTNRVRDGDAFLAAFEADLPRARAAGLSVAGLWRDVDEPARFHFLLEVEDRGRAEAFMNDPVSAAMGETATVLDGHYHWIEPARTSAAGDGKGND